MSSQRGLPARRFPGFGRLFRRLMSNTDGADTIEFALSAIPLLLFVLGVVDFSRLYWTQSEIQYAAEATARCATTGCCPGNASCSGSTGTTGLQQFAANQLLGLSASSGDLSNFAVTTQACGNQVTFNYNYNFIIGALISTSALTLTGTACNQG